MIIMINQKEAVIFASSGAIAWKKKEDDKNYYAIVHAFDANSIQMQNLWIGDKDIGAKLYDRIKKEVFNQKNKQNIYIDIPKLEEEVIKFG